VVSTEVNKMFGHNNEVMCMALSSDGVWLASASKARDASTATVLLWTAPAGSNNTGAGAGAGPNLQLVERLPGHESTVVCLQFSPDSRCAAAK
jgi:WD40 repeat protein